MYYYVDLDDNGCKNRDSVRVRVVDHVSISVMPDTITCRGDTIRLRIQSDGLQYQWTPTAQIVDPTVKEPLVFTPNPSTDYQVKAIIGGCSALQKINVKTVPYPVANAGPDTSICYNTPAFLHGTSDGSSWSWSPPNSLNDANILNPVSHTPRTTYYVLSAFDTKGCPKPGRDTVLVTVYPKMHISAGADTMVIVGQPLQLNATGGETYSWSPGTNLSSTSIANPVALFTSPFDLILYKVVGFSEDGCADSAYISIKVFKSGPAVFVPTAFTPNNDGRNDLLRPIAVGMKSIENFSIYNRWGQLIFHTRVNGQGWDGRVNGQLQDTGTFVWMVKATDYQGRSYFQKGTLTLIR
jgi:gliding motility-associated-like protein